MTVYESSPKALRLVCGCGHNLADAKRTGWNHDHTASAIDLHVRDAHVRMDTWRPMAMSREVTYTIRCPRCPRVHTIRAERITEAWARYVENTPRRVVHLRFGIEL